MGALFTVSLQPNDPSLTHSLTLLHIPIGLTWPYIVSSLSSVFVFVSGMHPMPGWLLRQPGSYQDFPAYHTYQ